MTEQFKPGDVIEGHGFKEEQFTGSDYTIFDVVQPPIAPLESNEDFWGGEALYPREGEV